jgi:hypothetical protein
LQLKIEASESKGEHWAKPYFDLMKEYEILDKPHNYNDIPTWGELASVIAKILIYIENK